MKRPAYRGKDTALHRRALAAVAALTGRRVYGDTQVTLADIVDAGLRQELERLELEHNGGELFTATRHRLRRVRRGGRPRNVGEE